jgi:hypothetical protein
MVTSSGSKHFPHVTHCRDFIENGQSVLPSTVLSILFEKNLLKDMRDAGLPNLQANCVAIRGNRSDAAHRIATGKCVNGYFRQQRVPVEQMAQPIRRAPERNTRVVAAAKRSACRFDN